MIPYREWLELAQNTTSGAELERLAQEIVLVSSPDYERPSSGIEFMQNIGFHGILAPYLDRSLIHIRGTADQPTLGDIIVALLENPNTSRQVLLRYAADYPEAFLNNPVLLLLLLEEPGLFRQMNELHLLKFLQHEKVPAGLINSMRSYASPTVLETINLHVAVAGEADADWRGQAEALLNEITIADDIDRSFFLEHVQLGTFPDWIVALFARHPAEDIRAVLDQQDQTTEPFKPLEVHNESIQTESLLDQPEDVRLHAAKSCNPSALALLVDDESDQVRKLVAQNPYTPVEQLALIEAQGDRLMRQGLARNANLTPELMERLAKDYTWGGFRMRMALVQHPNLSPAALDILAIDQASQVRALVVRHPNASAAIRQTALNQALSKAVYSEELILHIAAAQHPATPIQHLSKIMYSPYWQARYSLALNPSATPEILAFLVRDGNRLVRKATQSRLDSDSNKG